MAGYDYVNRYYQCNFKGGERVQFTEDGRLGYVARRRVEDQYVSIKFDDGTRGPCHPKSVLVLPE